MSFMLFNLYKSCLSLYFVAEENINAIKLLYDWLNNQEDVSDIELEKWIPETRQRP